MDIKQEKEWRNKLINTYKGISMHERHRRVALFPHLCLMAGVNKQELCKFLEDGGNRHDSLYKLLAAELNSALRIKHIEEVIPLLWTEEEINVEKDIREICEKVAMEGVKRELESLLKH